MKAVERRRALWALGIVAALLAGGREKAAAQSVPAETSGTEQVPAPSASPEEAEAGGAGASPAEDAAPEATPVADASRMVRIAVSTGAGAVSEAESRTTALLAHVGGDVSMLLVPGLDLGLGTEASFYDREYFLTSPDAQGMPGGAVTVAETRVRTLLHVGYDVLDGTGIGQGHGGLVVSLHATADAFVNDVVPQTAFGVGGALRAWARPADELVLDASASWLAAVSPGAEDVVSRLTLGGQVSDLRFGAGAALVLAPRARLRFAYAGEWLAFEHAARVSHAANVEVSIDL